MALTPTKDERVDFWMHAYARASFVQCMLYIDELLKSGASLHSPFRCAMTVAITTSYCRPFKQRKRVKLDKDLWIPTHYFELHNSVEEIRDKSIAHRDLDGPITDWGFISQIEFLVKKQSMEINTLRSIMPDDMATQLRLLVVHLKEEMDRVINEFVKKYSAQIPQFDGRYILSLDETPQEWLVKI